MTRNSQGAVDPLDFTDVLERQKSPGFKLTFIVPTDVNGSTESAIMTLRNQLREAKRVLLEHDHTEAKAEACLAPVAALAADSAYWRQRSRSLVIFLADEGSAARLGDTLT